MKHAVLTRRRPPRNAIELENNFQVRYWTQRLSISRNALGLAVQAVGTDPAVVERFVLRARDRCSVPAKEKRFPAQEASCEVGAEDPSAPEGTEDLLRLQYVSRAAPDLSPGAVEAIVARSTEFNARAGITGALVFTGSHFSQVLEGPAPSLQPLMVAILRDPRHRDVRMLYESAVPNRRFGHWAMVLVRDAGLQHLVEELWWAHRLDAARASRLVQHLLHGLQRETAGGKVSRLATRGAVSPRPDAAS